MMHRRTYVKRILMRSEGPEAEEQSLQRMKTTRSSGKPSKRSKFSGNELVDEVLGFFLNNMAGAGLGSSFYSSACCRLALEVLEIGLMAEWGFLI